LRRGKNDQEHRLQRVWGALYIPSTATGRSSGRQGAFYNLRSQY